jgi:signal transduction histidine kinase
VNETVDLQRPEEIARLRHYLRTALNQVVGYAELVRHLAEEQGARAEAGFMEQAAAAGREAIEIVRHLLPVKSHVSESALPLLRANLATRAGRIGQAIASFEAGSRGSCAAEMSKMRSGLRDLEEFAHAHSAPAAFEMPASQEPAPQLSSGAAPALIVGAATLQERLAPLLETAGLRPALETNAAGTLARLRVEPFELVLVDLSLPEAEVRAILDATRTNIPVVVLADPVQREAAIRAVQAGAAEILDTPIHPAIFGARIAALRRRQQTRVADAFSPLNLSEAVQEIAGLLRGALGKQVRLRMPFTQGLPAIPADARQLQQLVFNLVVNAGEAIGMAPGTVTVETGLRYLPDGAPAAPPFAELPPGYFVFVSVHDTGCGIDEAARGRIFEPFFSTRAAGRGLGLSTARGIALSHRGVIHVDTTPGKGSRFEVLLPAPQPGLGQH